MKISKKIILNKLDDSQIQRYSRNITLREIGNKGQIKLLNSKVLIVGAGGLGSPLMLYLTAAGVGTIGLIDNEKVDLSNLNRQVIHKTSSIGRNKVKSAIDSASAINPGIRFLPYPKKLTKSNAISVISKYDIVADGSDNFYTRYLINDSCYFLKKTLVSAAILAFDAQIFTFKPKGPCYRCIFSAPPKEDLIPSCVEGGVLGSIAGVAGTIQATEVVKELLGIGKGLSSSLMIFDGLNQEFTKIKIKNDPKCELCGKNPKIKKI